MQIKDVMRRHFRSVSPEDSVAAASQEMVWGRFRHLPVVEEGKLVGVVSDRDLLRHRGRGEVAVREVMTRSPRHASPDDSVSEVAARLVADQIDFFPVLRRGDLVGIVTTTDLLSAWVRDVYAGEAPAATFTAGELMSSRLLTAHSDDSILTAIDRMTQAGIRHLPVVDGDGRLLAMVSDRDIRIPSDVSPGRSNLEEYFGMAPLASVMNMEVVSIDRDATLAALVTLFVDRRLSAIPVIDEHERPVGIVSYVDVLRALAGEGPV